MAASGSGAQNNYIFLAGPDNAGSVTPGQQPPVLVLLSNGGGNNPVAVTAAAPEAIVPQFQKGAQLPLPPNGQVDIERQQEIPVRANQFAGIGGAGLSSGSQATLLSAMSNGQLLGGAAPRTSIGS